MLACTHLPAKHSITNNHARSHESRSEIKGTNSNGSKTSFKCDVCETSFKDYDILKTHKKDNHERKMISKFNCTYCDKSFVNTSLLESHIKEKHDQECQWLCDGCPFQASNAEELLHHLKQTGHEPSKSVAKKKETVSRVQTMLYL